MLVYIKTKNYYFAWREGLSLDEVIESVLEGSRSQTKVKTGIILAILLCIYFDKCSCL